MAEETLNTPESTKEEVMVVTHDEKVAVPEKEESISPVKSTSVETTEKAKEEVKEEKEKEKEKEMCSSVSFKEESSRVADLEDPEKKALDELKQLIQTALNNHEFSSLTTSAAKVEETQTPTPTPVVVAEEKSETESAAKESETEPAAKEKEEVEKKTQTQTPVIWEEKSEEPSTEVEVVESTVQATLVVVDDDGAKTVEAIEETIVAVHHQPKGKEEEEEVIEALVTKKEEEEEIPTTQPEPEEVSIYGVPLLCDERSDVILLKFLRARDFKVKEAFTMIKNTVFWRKKFGIDALLDEDLGNDQEKVVFMHGFDREGHPVCYNVYGEFQNKDLYEKTFSDEEKRQKFLKWRIQFLEKSIRKLDFSPGGISTIVQITDLKNSPGLGKWELRQATNQALNLLQDNYPEFVAKQVFINVPWWYLAFHKMISPFLTQRTKSKFVFAGPSKSAETLFKYITPEQVPVQYGGLSMEGEKEFSSTDPVTEITIKPGTKQTIEVPVSEACVLVWEVRVVGWEVNYGAEFVPIAEDGYTVIVHKTRKISSSSDEPVICDSFKIGEPGKIVITIGNLSTKKKKKFLYRSKTKPCCSD